MPCNDILNGIMSEIHSQIGQRCASMLYKLPLESNKVRWENARCRERGVCHSVVSGDDPDGAQAVQRNYGATICHPLAGCQSQTRMHMGCKNMLTHGQSYCPWAYRVKWPFPSAISGDAWLWAMMVHLPCDPSQQCVVGRHTT